MKRRRQKGFAASKLTNKGNYCDKPFSRLLFRHFSSRFQFNFLVSKLCRNLLLRKAKTIHPRKNLLLNLPMKIVRQIASPQSQHVRGTRLFAHPCHPGTMVTMMYTLRKAKMIHPRKNLLLNLPMKIVRQIASPQSQHIRGTRLFAHPCDPGTMATMMYKL